MKNFLADLRFGVRMLRKSPGFALTTIAVLALGIGANAAVFSVVDAVLLRSLPLRDPERVVMLWEKNPALGGSIGERVPAAYTNFLEWSRQAAQFEAIARFEDANFYLRSGAKCRSMDGFGTAFPSRRRALRWMESRNIWRRKIRPRMPGSGSISFRCRWKTWGRTCGAISSSCSARSVSFCSSPARTLPT